jgi:hypothetical protein
MTSPPNPTDGTNDAMVTIAEGTEVLSKDWAAWCSMRVAAADHLSIDPPPQAHQAAADSGDRA